jgi:small subunit ribosomal protein S21
LSIKIDVRNGNLEQAMRVLKKKLLKEGVFRLAKERSVYEKPSEKKRRKKKEGRVNMIKKQKMKKRLLGL